MRAYVRLHGYTQTSAANNKTTHPLPSQSKPPLLTSSRLPLRFTVPVLFDKETGTIVNNESSELVRMLNTEFNALAKNPSLDLYPEALRPAIDEASAAPARARTTRSLSLSHTHARTHTNKHTRSLARSLAFTLALILSLSLSLSLSRSRPPPYLSSPLPSPSPPVFASSTHTPAHTHTLTHTLTHLLTLTLTHTLMHTHA
eukprot:6191350-Pleurochrysis_carterae.AAC.1